jgi:hypothetical protein
MASTYSDLKIELIGTGEQVGTWGSTTNTNLGTALGEAITGSATVTFSSADVTLTLTNTNGTQTARNLRLVCAGTSGGARQLILGSGCQIDKLYLVQNDLADAVTIKNTTGTGVTIAAGKKQFVFNNGTNVVEAIDIGLQTVNLASDVTGTLPIANGGTGATDSATALSNLGGVTTAGARSALSFTPGSGAYNSGTGVITIPTNNNQMSQWSGFTTNTGTVTSVSGTGTASGLSLSGNVTTTGSLTLSGTVNSLAAGTYGINITGSAPYGSLTGKPASALRQVFNSALSFGAVTSRTYTFSIIYSSGATAREMPSPDSFVVVTAVNDFYSTGGITNSNNTTTKIVQVFSDTNTSRLTVTVGGFVTGFPAIYPNAISMKIFVQDTTDVFSLTFLF